MASVSLNPASDGSLCDGPFMPCLLVVLAPFPMFRCVCLHASLRLLEHVCVCVLLLECRKKGQGSYLITKPITASQQQCVWVTVTV